MEPVVVGARHHAGPVGMHNIADRQSGGRVEKGVFKLGNLEKLEPLVRSDAPTTAESALAALERGEMMEIETRKDIAQHIAHRTDDAALDATAAIRFLEKIQKSLVFEDVSVCVDQMLFHLSSASQPVNSSADIALELFDDELLVGDDRFDEVADGDHANEFAIFDDRQVAGALFGHQGHAFFDGLIEMSINHLSDHDFVDPSGRGTASLQDDLACIVALRNDADHVRAFGDHQSADLFFGHPLQRVEDRDIGRDAPNISSFDF